MKEIETEFIEEIEKKYVGKWIAIKGKDVFAVCDTHEEVYKKLKEKNVNDAYVIYSPTEEEKSTDFSFEVD